jgi:ATP synthase protein I
MLRAGLINAVGVAAVAAALSYGAAGGAGVAGSLAGSAIVAMFFATSFLVLDRTRHLDPTVTLLVALGLYVGKLIALLLALVLLEAAGALDGPLHRASMAITIVVATLVWSVVQIVAATRHRQPTYDLDATASHP